jgi:hypothetical protein
MLPGLTKLSSPTDSTATFSGLIAINRSVCRSTARRTAFALSQSRFGGIRSCFHPGPEKA